MFNERMEFRFDPGGMVTIIAGTHSHGQGHATAFSQLVAEWLGVPFEAINYIQGDTDKVAFGRGTFAARSSLVGGNGLRVAADAVIARGKEMAGALLEAAVPTSNSMSATLTVVGTDKQMSDRRCRSRLLCSGWPGVKLGLASMGSALCRRAGRCSELSERLPSLRSRSRSRNRRGRSRSFRRNRRSRHGDQPDDLRRPNSRRSRPRHRSGSVRECRL